MKEGPWRIRTVSTARTTARQAGVAATMSVTASGHVAVLQGRTVALVAVIGRDRTTIPPALGCTPSGLTAGSTLLAAIDGTVTTGATNGVETVRAVAGVATAMVAGQVVSTTAPGGMTRATGETIAAVVRRSVSASPNPRSRTTSSRLILNGAPGQSCAPWGVLTLRTLPGTWSWFSASSTTILKPPTSTRATPPPTRAGWPSSGRLPESRHISPATTARRSERFGPPGACPVSTCTGPSRSTASEHWVTSTRPSKPLKRQTLASSTTLNGPSWPWSSPVFATTWARLILACSSSRTPSGRVPPTATPSDACTLCVPTGSQSSDATGRLRPSVTGSVQSRLRRTRSRSSTSRTTMTPRPTRRAPRTVPALSPPRIPTGTRSVMQ